MPAVGVRDVLERRGGAAAGPGAAGAAAEPGEAHAGADRAQLTDVPALAADRLETVRVTLYDYTLEVDELKVDELKGRSVSSDGSVWSPPLPRQHAPGTACIRVVYVTKSGERVGAAVAWPGVLSATPAASTAAVQDAVASGGGFSPSGRRGGAAGQGSASAAPVFVQNGGAAG